MSNIQTCARCNHPNIIIKSWIEIIETRAGKSKLTHTQLACSDEKCEEEFVQKTAEEIRKRENMKLRNEAYANKKTAERNSLGTLASEKKIALK